MNNKDKIKALAVLSAFMVNFACYGIVVAFNLETTYFKMLGSFISIALVSIGLWRFPLGFYLTSLAFVFLSSTLGSLVNLYYYVDEYDLFIHFLSGVYLFEGGKVLFDKLIKSNVKFSSIKPLFSLSFACALAGVWEIYEYFIDITLSANMQGSKQNTMNDIVAGTLGALTGFVICFLFKKSFFLKRG